MSPRASNLLSDLVSVMKLSKLPHLTFTAAISCILVTSANAESIELESRRELFVDDYVIESISGDARLQLHRPQPREIAIVHDAPWEGTASGYHSIFKDGDRYRMYYKSMHIDFPDGELRTNSHPRFCAYAESADGIVWEKPRLGLHEFGGSKANNIVITSDAMNGLAIDAGHPAVFKDQNPNAPASARYKAILRSSEKNGLIVLASADGIRWGPHFDHLILRLKGAFDSQNLAFWDPTINRYRAYWRTSPEGIINDTEWKPKGPRSIRAGVSTDLNEWESIEDLSYDDALPQEMYTNGVFAYHRAPHILLGFPMRYIERENGPPMEALPDPENRAIRAGSNPRYGYALSEGLLMASRNGRHFKRWNEAFLRPGPERPGTWHYGAPSIAWGIIETESTLPGAGKELSLYALENYWHGQGSALRRYTLRLDGFVSVSAGWGGGALLTKPLTFDGSQLELNFATSAAGSLRVELQHENGQPIPGFSLKDCPDYFGDSVDKSIKWNSDASLSTLTGKSVRIRFELKDADLYSFRIK